MVYIHMYIDSWSIISYFSHSVNSIYEGHSISNAILAMIFSLNMLLKFDLAILKHKFNSSPARQFNT